MIKENTIALHFSGFLCAALYVCQSVGSHYFEYASLSGFLILNLCLFLISVNLCWQYVRNAEMPPFAMILLWAVIFRVIGIFSLPIFEDDFYRYLWDAFQFSENGTPYGVAPSTFFGDESFAENFQAVLGGINNPDIPTIYGPIFQYSFLFAYWFAPGEVVGLQIVYASLDILLIMLLAKMGSKQFIILYAWCPLVIKETAFTAHPDILGVVLLMGSFYCLRQSWQRPALVLIALSLCAKVFAVLLVPFVLLRCQVRYWWYVPAVVALIYAPFVWQNSADFAGLSAFANDWQFNSSVYSLINQWLPAGTSKLLCLILFALFYFSYLGAFYIDKAQRIPRGDWIFGMFFLLGPVLNAWYLIWLLAFAAIFPSIWAWVASFAVLLSYITGLTLDDETLALYQQPLWARVLEYSLVAIALGFDIRHRRGMFWRFKDLRRLTTLHNTP